MTIASLSWAVDQPIPETSKLVLIGISYFADDETGLVDIAGRSARIANIAQIEEKALPNYLGALRRNRYLARTPKGDFLLMDWDAPRIWDWHAPEPQEEADSAPSARPVSSAAPARFQKARQAEIIGQAKPPKQDGYAIFEGSKADDAFRAYYRAKREKFPQFPRKLMPNSGGVMGWAYVMPVPWPAKEEEQIAV